jgi:hypothetical protein
VPDEPETALATRAGVGAANPWVRGAASIGAGALVAGILLAVFGGPSGYAADAGPGMIRLGIAFGLGLVGLGLLLSALVIVGVGWYLRHPRA